MLRVRRPTIGAVSETGDGWVECDLGHRHWGRFGAVGLLLRRRRAEIDPARSADPREEVLLQLRAEWSHHGGTWGLPGGARNRSETPLQAALREAAEETTLDPDSVNVEASFVDDHGGWSYTTVVATAGTSAEPSATSAESIEVGWVRIASTGERTLHPGFAATWPRVREIGPAPLLLVDAANVMGARPDGWWKDRPAGVRRLRDGLVATRRIGLDPVVFGESDSRIRIFPELLLVTEGVTRSVEGAPGVKVVAGSGSADDTIVELAAARADGMRQVWAVTADRELGRRLKGYGVSVLRPRTLWQLIDDARA